METTPPAAPQASPPAAKAPPRRRRWWFPLAAVLVPMALLFAAGEVIVRARYDIVAPKPYPWPGNMRSMPMPLMWANLPAYKGTWFQETEQLPVTHNELGMRDPPLTAERKAARRRVLFIGDSITYGRGVADGEPFATRLEARWNAKLGGGVATFNAGVSGYDTHQESATLRELGPTIDPQVVIVGWYRNDVQVPSATVSAHIIHGQFAESEEAYQAWKARYIDHSNPLDWSALLRLARLEWKDFKLRHWDLEARARRVGEENKGAGGGAGGGADDGGDGEGHVDEAAAMLATQQALRDMDAWCKARGAKLAVVLFPAREEVEAETEMAHPPHLLAMAAQCQKDGIPVLDLFDPWRAWAQAHRGETLYIHRDRCHPNARGHDQVATWIEERFTDLVAGR